MEPGAIDVDRSYHAQCADLPTDYILWLTDNKYRAWGTLKISLTTNFLKVGRL